MLFESLGVKQGLILIRDPIPMSVMLAIHANLVRLATLLSVQAKIQTDFVFQLPFFRVGCACGYANFGMKETHLQALIGRTAFPSLLFAMVLLAFLFLAAFAFSRGGNSWNSCNNAIVICKEQRDGGSLSKEAVREGRDLLWDSIVFDVLCHLL
jgi:hypothetical protein